MVKQLKLPYGFKDYLPQECYNKVLVEGRLTNLYKSYGYMQVETPSIEYYDTFHDVYRPDKLKNTFKLTDNDGSLLALRPDITLQICRMAANFDLSSPKRTFYRLSSFEYIDDINTARTREFAQIGVELFGASGLFGEAEIVTLAIKSLQAAGLKNFTIEIGNNDFFKGIADESGLSPEKIGTLTSLIDRKAEPDTEIFLQQNAVPENLAQVLRQLPTLFGKKEVFEIAEKFASGSRTLKALAHTKKLYEFLEECGYGEFVSVDLGILHGLNYYSGTVIKGYCDNFGLCLLEGGRYDGICSSFGYDGKAVGFAIGTQRLLDALGNLGKLKTLPASDYAYICETANAALETEVTEKLRGLGYSVVKTFFEEKNQLEEYCKAAGIENCFSIVGNKVVTILGEVRL